MAFAHLLQLRPAGGAFLVGVLTAQMERAAVGADLGHIGRLTLDGMQSVAAGQIQPGHRPDEA